MIDVAKLTNIAMRAGLTSPCGVALDAISKLPPRHDVSFVPPPPRHDDERHFDLVAAALAGGMIAAAGREHTAAEAVGVFQTVRAGLTYEVQPAAKRPDPSTSRE